MSRIYGTTYSVPIKFGIQYYAIDGINDIKLKVSDNEFVKANSMVLIKSSSVFEKAIVECGKKEIDMQDFDKASVECFIKSLYAGVVTDYDPSVFRYLNKMSRMYQVKWMIRECEKCFEDLIARVGKDLSRLAFVYQEALYVAQTLGDDKFLAKFLLFLDRENIKRAFVANRVNELATFNLENIVESLKVAGKDTDVVIDNLYKRIEDNEVEIDDNLLNLLARINFRPIRKSKRRLFEKFFTLLVNKNPENSVQIFELYRKNMSDDPESLPREVISPFKVKDYKPHSTVHNWTKAFDSFASLDMSTFLKDFSASPQVENLLMFLDGVFVWVSSNSLSVGNHTDEDVTNFFKKILEVKQQRSWQGIPEFYVRQWIDEIGKKVNITRFVAKLNGLTDSFIADFVAEGEWSHCKTREMSTIYLNTPIELYDKLAKRCSKCSLVSDCGVSVKVDAFNNTLGINEASKKKIHLHEMADVHVYMHVNGVFKPITWTEKNFNKSGQYINWPGVIFGYRDTFQYHLLYKF